MSVPVFCTHDLHCTHDDMDLLAVHELKVSSTLRICFANTNFRNHSLNILRLSFFTILKYHFVRVSLLIYSLFPIFSVTSRLGNNNTITMAESSQEKKSAANRAVGSINDRAQVIL